MEIVYSVYLVSFCARVPLAAVSVVTGQYQRGFPATGSMIIKLNLPSLSCSLLEVPDPSSTPPLLVHLGVLMLYFSVLASLL